MSGAIIIVSGDDGEKSIFPPGSGESTTDAHYGVRMFGCETSEDPLLAAALPATPPLQDGDNLHVLGSVPVKIR